jgi:pimeloyl-ACP methyl ester carboxylesterase
MRLARWLIVGFMLLVLVLLGYASVLAPDRTVAELSPRWAPPPSRFVRVGALSVHVRDEGPREDTLPIVLLHGTSASLHTWDGWAAAMTPTRRVIRLDLPGFGLTGPDAQQDYTIPHYRDVVLALLDSLHVVHFDVAGNSLGGEIAWRLAVGAPRRVRRLVLVDAAGYPFASASVPIGFRLASMPGFSWLFTRILPRRVVESSVRNVYGNPTLVSEALVDRYYELTLREGNRAALPLRMRQQSVPGDTTLIAHITAPTLILWGAKDGLIPPDVAERFRRDIPGSRVVMYPELGHVPHEENAVQTARDALRFLSMP